MRLLAQQWWVAVVLAGWFGMADRTLASHGIHDDGKFFSAGAVERASAKIKDIDRDHQKDLLIETVAEIPAALKAQFDKQGKKEFFQNWSRQAAEDAKVKGIHIFICRQPGHLQIDVDRATRDRGFPISERDRLVQKLLPLLKEKKGDAVLQEAVDFVAATLQSNLGKQRSPAGKSVAPAAPGAPVRPVGANPATAKPLLGGGIPLAGLICLGVAGLLGVGLIIMVLRSLGGRGAAAGGYGAGGSGGGYGGGGGGGGGGLLTSVVGGLFGAAAGNWMYDRFFRGNSSGWGQQPTSTNSSSDPVQPDAPGAGDFSSDSGGGADFDAGDSGGGDFGGGDFDGGGDFGGGDGGGDSW